ncbi:carbohydrate ABC transporter permease [Streptomyces physcomitrii]|uniref:Carbohydrate ABC transporter permease n=1 Tax=Streptomyces physcomitrii TaxID=2724184 RepID=A0ABX1H276_9ACTN|nr:carbohydrate ABC transporter permease [Streptomyces physcomitrii]NKI42158.1 carbohydrate ABC transporter permease [Streptomyces physcomitrii]
MATATANRPRRRLTLGRGAAYLGAWAYALMLLLPLYYLVISSFKDNAEIFADPLLPNGSLSLDKFGTAVRDARLDLALLNSAAVTLCALVLVLVLAVPASYALARAKGRTAAVVERIFSLGFLVPTFAALVPTFLLAAETGLFYTRTFVVLFLPATSLPLAVVLLTQFMRTVPDEVEEAARMDGAGNWTILLRIYLPMVVPGIVTVLILSFLAFWNEYLYSLVIIGPDQSQRTLQVAVPTLRSTLSTDFGVLSAGTVFTLLPVYVVYALLQRRMEGALMGGAVKV